LREALTLSEASRQGLANSYALLQEQTDALTQSEAALSELARQLEKDNEELKIANEEVRSFAYITSHDLRSPLINLKGFAAELRLAWTTIRPVTQQALPQLEEAEQTAVNQALEVDMPEALDLLHNKR
jgi:signal transduction histidine kinase